MILVVLTLQKNNKDLYGLRYAEFVVPLVKAVQELSEMNDAKDAKIDTLQQQNINLQKQFNDLKTLVLSIQQQNKVNAVLAVPQVISEHNRMPCYN